MLVSNQEVIDPQTKIVFIRMSDKSILLRIPGEIKLFSKSDLIEYDWEQNQSYFTKKEVIEAFERVELSLSGKRLNIITGLDGIF